MQSRQEVYVILQTPQTRLALKLAPIVWILFVVQEPLLVVSRYWWPLSCLAPGAASILQGQVVTGVRLAESRGRSLNPVADDEEDGPDRGRKFQYLTEVLKWRSHSAADHVLFSQIGPKVGSPPPAWRDVKQLLVSSTGQDLKTSFLNRGFHRGRF